MTASLDIKGLDEIVNKLNTKFSERRVNQFVNSALTVAGRYAATDIKNAVGSYRDTGATVNEITAGKARLRGGVRNIRIGWSGDGSKQRWRQINRVFRPVVGFRS